MHRKPLNLFSRTGTGKTWLTCLAMGLFLLVGILPVWAKNAKEILTEQDAVRLGLERPEIIQQMQSRIELAESDIVKARTWVNPEFSFDQETSDDGPEDVTERSYMLSQEFSLSRQRSLQTAAAKQRRDAEKWDVEKWRLEKIAEIQQKFYNVLYQQQLMEIYTQIRSAMDVLEKIMQERKNAGDISVYDLNRLQQERASLVADQSQALAEQQRLIQNFSAYLGLADKEACWSGVKGRLLPQTNPRSLDDLLELAASQPDLMAMKLQTEAFATDERHATRSWLPDLTIGLGFKDTDETDGDAVLFGASLPIPIFDRNVAERQRAMAKFKHLQSEYRLALEEKKGTIRGLWYQYKKLAAAVKSLAQTDSSALLETAKIAYRAGEIGILEILDAHRSTFEHQVQLLDLMKAARQVRIELDLNTGGNIQ